MSASLLRLLTVTAATKRAAVSGGKRGEPTAHLAMLEIAPPMPVSPELRERLGLRTAHELLQTFAAAGADVREGDTLVTDGTDYPVRSVANWPGAAGVLHLVIEDLKR